MVENDDFRAAFLAVQEFENNPKTLRGCVLVTDVKSYPTELRYTGPVTATRLETIAYGLVLKDGISLERIAIPLLDKIEEQPKLIFIMDAALLKLQKHTKIPVCCLTNTDTITDSSDPSSFLVAENHLYQRALELTTRMDEIDLHEPFNRIKDALEYIHFEAVDDIDRL